MSYKIVGVITKPAYHDFLIEEDGEHDVLRFDRLTESTELASDRMGIRSAERLYAQYLAELLIDRKDMPQIKDMDGFVQWCRGKCTVVKRMVDPKDCEPVQLIDPHKVAKLVSSHGTSGSKLEKPVLLAKDLKIVDGHHRWAGKKEVGEKFLGYIMNVDFAKAYNLAMEFFSLNK